VVAEEIGPCWECAGLRRFVKMLNYSFKLYQLSLKCVLETRIHEWMVVQHGPRSTQVGSSSHIAGWPESRTTDSNETKIPIAIALRTNRDIRLSYLSKMGKLSVNSAASQQLFHSI
jgi:hypothetical protein